MSEMAELPVTAKPDVEALNSYLFDACGYVQHSAVFGAEEVQEFERLLRNSWPQTAPGGVARIRSLIGIAPQFREIAVELAANLDLENYINQPFRLIESYALRRAAGSVQTLHNGFSRPIGSAPAAPPRTMWRHHTYHDGKIYCMMVKVLIYLTDIAAEDDAPFCLVEGSHKANCPFPFSEAEIEAGIAPLSLPNIRPVFPRAGDVLIINEALMHGTYPKRSPDPRIVMAFSYSPSFVADYREAASRDPGDIWSTVFYP